MAVQRLASCCRCLFSVTGGSVLKYELGKTVKHPRKIGWPSKATLSLAIGLALLGGASVCGSVQVMAQATNEALTLVVPSAAKLAPNGEIALPIQVTPAGALPRRAIVLIRGLPSTVTLSEGRLFESGVWGVPATDIDKVKMISMSTAVGRSDVGISIVTIDGTLLAEARTSLIIKADVPAAQAGNAQPGGNTVFTATQPQQDAPAAPSPTAAPRLTPQQSATLMAIVRKGDEHMAAGNVSAARLLYRHAAEGGLAAGALALAISYDGEELRRRNVKGGVQADPKEAQIWYEKAGELGSAEAMEQLQRFGAR